MVEAFSRRRCGGISIESLSYEWLKILQEYIGHAERLRPSNFLGNRKSNALLNAENRVIVASEWEKEKALARVVEALVAIGQSSEQAKSLVDAWSAARALIPKNNHLRPACSALH